MRMEVAKVVELKSAEQLLVHEVCVREQEKERKGCILVVGVMASCSNAHTEAAGVWKGDVLVALPGKDRLRWLVG